MKKLFIFQNNSDAYESELEAAYSKMMGDATKIGIELLNVDYLIDNDFDIVICNRLPKQWYFTLRGLNIVSITLGNRENCEDYSDIVIDYFSENDKRYFTGNSCSISQNGNFKIIEIFDLIEILKWDSEFFGFNIAFLSCMHLTENIMYRIEKFIMNENVKLIEYLCNCHDRRSVRVAEKNGFRFVDMRLTYKKSMQQEEAISLGKWHFGRAEQDAIVSLKEMVSGDFYKDSRYFFDGNFEIKKIDEFYQGWIEKGVLGEYDDECWCLYDNNMPVAFCTLKYAGNKRVNIGIFGIDRKYQGMGLGKKLLCCVYNMLMAKNIENIFVVTQGRNYEAQCLYQSFGFRTETTQLWYHKWQ